MLFMLLRDKVEHCTDLADKYLKQSVISNTITNPPAFFKAILNL